MALVPSKSRSQLIREVVDYINSRYKLADLSKGVVFRDLLIEAPMQFIATTVNMTNFIGQVLDFSVLEKLVIDPAARIETAASLGIEQSLMDNVISQIIDLFGSNYNLTRKEGTRSSGVLTFYSLERPTTAIRILAGTTVRVPDTGISFQTLKDVTLDGTNLNYNLNYDSNNNRWFVTVPAQCGITGVVGNVPANSITQIDGGGIPLFVTNDNAFSGGTNPEDDASFLSRIRRVLRGNFKGTADSILASVFAYPGVKDAKIAFLPDDPNKIRESINAIDIFVYSGTSTNIDSTITVSNPTYVQLPLNYVSNINSIVDTTASNYAFPTISYSLLQKEDGTSFILFSSITGKYIKVSPYGIDRCRLQLNLSGDSNNPVFGEFPDFVDGENLSTDGRIKVYILQGGRWVDTTVFWAYSQFGSSQSLRSTPHFLGTSPIVSIVISPKYKDVLRVNSDYNSDIEYISQYLLHQSRKFVGQDIKVFSATPVGIVADITIQVSPDYGTSDREAIAKQKFIELLNSYTLGVELNQTAFISELLKIAGVLDVKFNVFTRNRDTRNGISDILLGSKEYPTLIDMDDLKITGTYSPIGL